MSAATKSVVGSYAVGSGEDDQLDRAIERAGKNGVKVLATGRIKSTAQRFWIVSSATDAAHPHLCFLMASGRLSCDCKAGRASRVCQHVAAVVMFETVQADRRRRQAEEIEAAEREEREAVHARLCELNARLERHGPRGAQPRQMEPAYWQRAAEERDAAPLYRDNKPFSIFR